MIHPFGLARCIDRCIDRVHTEDMNTWSVTLKTGQHTWSTITVEATDHKAAVRTARRLLGDFPVSGVI